MSKVVLKNIKKSFNKDKSNPIINNFNLTIEDKEFVVLVGPSGCGKSTTIRMIAGLESISDGQIIIDDVVVNDLEPVNRDIAMVFQNYALYPHMSVYDNIAFTLKLKKYSKKEIAEKVHAAAKILDIDDLLDRKPKELSGGQRQRVAIGRAIVRNPKVFLMDEPLSNLDAKLRNQMRAEIIKLRKKIDTTFIYVTHDQTEAMTLGDRIVVMKDGDIMQVGTPEEVFHYPENIFVAGFIGTPQMNIFKSNVILKNGLYYCSFHDFLVLLPPEAQALFQNKNIDEVFFGIRPQDIFLVSDSSKSHGVAMIEFTEKMGNEEYIHCLLDDTNLIISHTTNVVDPDENGRILPDKEINLVFNTNAIHLFDIKTEKRIYF